MGLRSFVKRGLKKVKGQQSGSGGATTIREALSTLPTEPDADGFIAVVPSDMVKEGGGNTFTWKNHGVAVFRVEGSLYVIDDACTHEDGPLGEGEISGTVVTCPYHDWRFDMKTGECLSHKNRHVACYSVKEKDGFIWVGSKTHEGSQERGGEHDDGLISPIIHV